MCGSNSVALWWSGGASVVAPGWELKTGSRIRNENMHLSLLRRGVRASSGVQVKDPRRLIKVEAPVGGKAAPFVAGVFKLPWYILPQAFLPQLPVELARTLELLIDGEDILVRESASEEVVFQSEAPSPPPAKLELPLHADYLVFGQSNSHPLRW